MRAVQHIQAKMHRQQCLFISFVVCACVFYVLDTQTIKHPPELPNILISIGNVASAKFNIPEEVFSSITIAQTPGTTAQTASLTSAITTSTTAATMSTTAQATSTAKQTMSTSAQTTSSTTATSSITPPNPSSAPGPLPSPLPSTDITVTFDEFKQALSLNAFTNMTSIQEKYTAFVQGVTPSGISSKRELAMFYAQMLHESGGLQYMSELACTSQCAQPPCCTTAYGGPNSNGQYFYGRGYIQLSWEANYRAASKYLFNGDEEVLAKNPDLVATNQTLAWGTAFWFWRDNVHHAPGVVDGKFGAATKAINGALECSSPGNPAAQKRFQIYSTIFKAWNIAGIPDETGCYN